MSYKLIFTNKAREDYLKLDGSQRKIVNKAIKKVLSNPLPVTEGGYGKPLSNFSSSNLAGLLKIKLKSSGIRIVYKVEKTENTMLIIIIGTREDGKVYNEAVKRLSNLDR